MKKTVIVLSVLAISLLTMGPAYGCYVSGKVLCDVGDVGVIGPADIPLANVKVIVTGTDFYQETLTDSDGYYYITLLDTLLDYTIKIEGLPADAVLVLPASNPLPFSITAENLTAQIDWLVSSQTCRSGACWLTAGGVKFEPVLGIKAAEKGPKFSFGGNTFPGCSPTAGDGGQWNFVDHAMKLHFQGWSIDRVTCGNVIGIPEGSTSPRTPYNFIEFSGTGTMKGIAGNKVSYDPVYFFVRAEDRNEPGNEKALLPDGGELVDRLFLHVFSNLLDPNGSTLYLIDANNDPATVDPVTITGGNIQLHISSCP